MGTKAPKILQKEGRTKIGEKGNKLQEEECTLSNSRERLGSGQQKTSPNEIEKYKRKEGEQRIQGGEGVMTGGS